MTGQIKEITPDPLITSIVEIRFSSTLKTDDILGEFYKIWGSKFPKVITKDFPREIKSQIPDLKFTHDYTIRNDEYSISFSDSLISFENVGKYKLWNNYFLMIKENLPLLKNVNKINSLIRVGVRYASVFEVDKPLEETTNLAIKLNVEGYKQEKEFFRFNLNKGDINMHLQIMQHGKVKKNNIERTGLYIDIDSSQSNNLPQDFNSNLLDIIDTLHSEEKFIFQNLMKQSFLDTLEILYK